MELFLGAMAVAWVIQKLWSQAKLDHTYAKQGQVSPRLKAKYGSEKEANLKVAKYGFLDHLRDAWRDYWPRRTDAVIAARDARAAGGGPPRLRDRIAAAKEYIRTKADKVIAAKAKAKANGEEPAEPEPVPEPEPVQPTVVAPPVNIPAPVDVDDTPAALDDDSASPEAEPTEPAVPAQPTGGTTVTAPTGEVVNYETHRAELLAAMADVQQRIDADAAALLKFEETKAAVDAMQAGYQAAATAAATRLDHEAALNLDSETLGHAGTGVDAMPVGAIDGLYDQVELVENQIRIRLEQDEIALAALEAELRGIDEMYGDAHATVAGNLSGDSRYLDSGGTSQPASNPQSLRAGAQSTGREGGQGPTGVIDDGAGLGTPAGTVQNVAGGFSLNTDGSGVTNTEGGTVRTFEGPVDARHSNFGQMTTPTDD